MSYGSDLWSKATDVVSTAVEGSIDAAKVAAAEAAALKIDEVFDIDKSVLNGGTSIKPPPDPELEKTRAPSAEEDPDAGKLPAWAIPAAVVVVVVLATVAFLSKKKGSK